MKKRLCILLFIVLTASGLRAENLPYADYKRLHFGFTLGLNGLDFGFKPTQRVIDGRVYQVDVSNVFPGFTVGVIGDLRLAKYFNLRLIPCLHLGQRTISYTNNIDDEILRNNIKSALITIPLYLKYNAPRINDYRFYLLAGGGLSFDLARDRQNPVLLGLMDYYIEFGTGCTIYFPFFRFSPEIKFAIGFNNLLTPLDQRTKDVLLERDYKYTQALGRITSRMITLVFNFE